MVYRFKVTYEDHEDVYRHIEIKSSQTFLELHTAIQQSIGFDNSKSATFYMSDDYWRKEAEICVENTGDDKSKKPKTKKGDEPVKKKTISDHIESPHQHFVYVFDPEREWTFLLELIKIVPEEKGTVYPQCIKTNGTSPKQYKVTTPPPPVPEEEEDDIPKKGAKKTVVEQDEPAPIALEKEPMDEEIEGFISLDEDGEVEKSGDEDDIPSDGEEDAGGEDPGDEDAEGAGPEDDEDR